MIRKRTLFIVLMSIYFLEIQASGDINSLDPMCIFKGPIGSDGVTLETRESVSQGLVQLLRWVSPPAINSLPTHNITLVRHEKRDGALAFNNISGCINEISKDTFYKVIDQLQSGISPLAVLPELVWGRRYREVSSIITRRHFHCEICDRYPSTGMNNCPDCTGEIIKETDLLTRNINYSRFDMSAPTKAE